MTNQKEKIAVIAITRNGSLLAEKLQGALGKRCDLFISGKLKRKISGKVRVFEASLKAVTEENFNRYVALVYFVSLGVVVRSIAPFLKEKHVDPAVIAIDDRGHFVISVLSGHVGGANALTGDIAKILGARPVVTTASDAGQTIPVDILGREFGWTTELNENITPVSAAVVNEEPVGLFQDAGEKNWWERDVPIPSNLKIRGSLDELSASGCKAALIISDRILEGRYRGLLQKSVIYRPKTLAVGMGCVRGTPASELETLLQKTFLQHGLSLKCVKNISTVDLKKREPGLLSVCARHGWELVCYTPEQLGKLKNILPTPSRMVQKYLQIPGVAEPAAMLSAQSDQLVVPKTKGPGSTIAVARINFDARNGERKFLKGKGF